MLRRVLRQEVTRAAGSVVRIGDATSRRTRGELILATGIAALMRHGMTAGRMVFAASRTLGIRAGAELFFDVTIATAVGVALLGDTTTGHATIAAAATATAATAAALAGTFVAVCVRTAATEHAFETTAAGARGDERQGRDGKERAFHSRLHPFSLI